MRFAAKCGSKSGHGKQFNVVIVAVSEKYGAKKMRQERNIFLSRAPALLRFGAPFFRMPVKLSKLGAQMRKFTKKGGS